MTSILGRAGNGVFGLDRDDRCTFVNEPAAIALGFRPHELIGKRMHDCVHHSHADGSAYPIEQCPTHVAMRDRVELRRDGEVFWRRDGTAFPVEYEAHPVVVHGEVTGAVVVFRDPGERRRADDLVRSEVDEMAWQASLLDLTHDAILVRDMKGTITFWNRAAELTYGWTADEAIGQQAHHLLQTRFPEPLLAINEALLRGGQWDGRLQHRRRDGTPIVVATRWSLRKDDEGRPDVIMEINIDISAVEIAEQRFQGLLEGAPDAIVGVDARGRIALVNAQTERLFGYTRDELVGRPVEILIPESVRANHPAHRAAYFSDPVPRPMGAGVQLVGRRKDGSEFPADIALSALQTAEGLLVSASVRDVTERERLRAQAEHERMEARLHQTQRLESLGQLAGGVAHDFNNLLAVIVNYAAFINEEVSEAAKQPGGERWVIVQNDLAQVQRAAERATELTHQLLAFGRREVVRPRTVDLNAIVREIETLLRRSIGEHVQLVIGSHPNLWPILADPGQLEQVLVNLAVNARDAMPAGGTLSIDTVNLIVDDDFASSYPGMAPGRYVRLRVSDTGTGMPPEVAARAFEPFFTTKPKGSGTGLGLATVYGIVTQAGGQARLYSEPGLGTTFSALFPATDAVPAAVAPNEAPVPRRRSETVLVVEDEEALREVTGRILARHGHEVLTAVNGAAAIERAAHYPGPIDLLLTDVVMPQMLGKEVAERVRALRPEIRVLFMSGYAQPVLASQGTLEDGVALVEKPFTESELLAKVREALDAAN